MSTTHTITKNGLVNVVPALKGGLTNELSSAPGRSERFAHLLEQTGNTFLSHGLPAEWEDQEYRQAAMEATVQNMIAWGVKVNRESRGLTQSQLAERMGTKQSAISKLEDTEGGDVQLSKLIKAAHALDLALLVKFVGYPEFAALTKDVSTSALFAEGWNPPDGQIESIQKG